VTETADWFAYASRVRALLAIHERTPSLDRIDHLVGDRTRWEGIAVMPPAADGGSPRLVAERSGTGPSTTFPTRRRRPTR
jgi:hypothetical protein